MDLDRVDRLLEQWRRERPDLDLAGDALVNRLASIEKVIRSRLGEAHARHGLEAWEFEVLATLRRSGPPYRLTPGELLPATRITSGAMTNRIDRLEGRHLVARSPDPGDGRRVLVGLTAAGRAVVDAALTDHASVLVAILAPLDRHDRRRLEDLLRALHRAAAPDGGGEPAGVEGRVAARSDEPPAVPVPEPVAASRSRFHRLGTVD